MKTLYYICQWGNNRKTAWSGTYLSLFNELRGRFDLKDTPIEQSFFTKIKRALIKRLNIGKFDFSYSELRSEGKKTVKAITDEQYCSFQYAELPNQDYSHSYIYQDMCADYIKNVILTTPSYRDHYMHQKMDMKALEKRCIAQKNYYDKCAGIFTMGQWLADYLVDTIGVDKNKVHCIGAGVDIDTSKINPHDKTKRRILFVGRSFAAKGGYLVIEAFKILRAKYMQDAELYIIGPQSNPMIESVDGVHYEGVLPVEKVAEYYNFCDIFCMPSYIDAYGKVFAEALCSGMPCIARNVLSMPEIVIDGVNGYCIDNDDSENLALVMYKLLTNDEIHSFVEKNMVEYQIKYSWSSVADAIAKVINQDSLMQ